MIVIQHILAIFDNKYVAVHIKNNTFNFLTQKVQSSVIVVSDFQENVIKVGAADGL